MFIGQVLKAKGRPGGGLAMPIEISPARNLLFGHIWLHVIDAPANELV